MKKLFVLVFFSLLLSVEGWADPITLAKAKEYAKEYLDADAPTSPMKLRGRSQAPSANQPLYIFSRGAGKGYVIVSGDDCLPTILGYTESGDFDEDNLPPALKAWIEQYEHLIIEAQKAGAPARVGPQRAAGNMDINPLITTHWHQTWPYNNMCPMVRDENTRAVTGCVATAASQILYYWRKDLNDRTQYNTPTYTWGHSDVTQVIKKGTPLKWDLLKTSYSGNESKEYTDAVALINYVIGTCCSMDYGTSSGAYIENLVDPFKRQFGLASKNIWRRGMAQDKWEKMIYDDLVKKRPIEYAGYTTEMEGHAVVLDGYKCRTNLFHFNFGWGGQGDGWYTLDDVTGVNGFGTEQSITYDIYPLHPNVDAEMMLKDGGFLPRMENKIKVKITNNGTLPMCGFYLFCLSGTTTPASISKANDSNTDVVVNPGETGYLEFSYIPTSTSKPTVYITDADLNVLAKQKAVEIKELVADLSLQRVTVDDCGEYDVEMIGGVERKVMHVYDSKHVNAFATLLQNENGKACQPSVYGYIFKVSEDGSETQVKSSNKADVVFLRGKENVVEYSIAGLTDGQLYKFAISNSARTGRSYDINFATPDSMVYFRLMGQNISADTNAEERTTHLKGKYNKAAMEAFTQDSNICIYDVTQLQGVSNQLSAANPNALFYADASQNIAGRNIIVDGVCDELSLIPGYDFSPKEAFKALRASYTTNEGIAKFGTLVLPFDANVPDGMFARKVNVVGSSYLDDVDSCNVQLSSCTPYLIITSGESTIKAERVDVNVNVPSTGSEIFRGTFVNLAVNDSILLLDDASTQYFNVVTNQTSVPALTAYLCGTRKVRANSMQYSTKDKKNLLLASEIVKANDLLNQYEYQLTTDAMKELQQVIAKANNAFTNQPETDSLNTIYKEVQAAEAACLASIPKTDVDGNLDVSYLIANSSFETGTTMSGWVKNQASVVTMNSESTNMFGADGKKVANIKKGGSIEQLVNNVEDGEYVLKASVAADYGNHITLYADSTVHTVAATDFGPYYMAETVTPSFHVRGGSFTISVYAEEGWVKVDNFRLYQVYSDGIAEVDMPETSTVAKSGIYDMTGRRLNRILQPGIYIVNGKKIKY